MGVWAVPEDKQDTFGNTAAGFEQVSHCYLRPSYPDWPYNIFTMIHTQDREQATGVLKAISAATGVSNYRALYSTHEFKKVRVQYFTGDVEAWEVGVDTRQPEPRNVPS
jgi:DNA-binding Lrp family transcriptional regulator